MKTSGERKPKSVVAPKKHNTTAVCAGVEKPGSRNHGRQPKVKGGSRYIVTKDDQDVLPFNVSQVVDKQLLNNCTSYRESSQSIPVSELATGQSHPSSKIKLQLFPIDEGTRMGLEMDGHNPFLELTLRSRKKISSVLKHLNSKWGSSRVAKGEIVLFPFDIQLDKFATSRRWTLNESGTSAGDIYAAIGSPAIFRMRYGWLFGPIPENSSASMPLVPHLESEGIKEACCRTLQNNWKNDATSAEMKPVDISKAAAGVTNAQLSQDVAVDGVGDQVKVDIGLARTAIPWDDTFTNLSIGGLLSEASLMGKIKHGDDEINGTKRDVQPMQLVSDISFGALFSEASLQGKISNWDGISNGSKFGLQTTTDKGYAPSSSFPWDDSMTTLSIGGLLSEASLQGRINNCDHRSNGSKSELQPTLLISDSLDAFIAGQFNTHPQVSKPSSHSSILDAEETCHAFPSRKLVGK